MGRTVEEMQLSNRLTELLEAASDVDGIDLARYETFIVESEAELTRLARKRQPRERQAE